MRLIFGQYIFFIFVLSSKVKIVWKACSFVNRYRKKNVFDKKSCHTIRTQSKEIMLYNALAISSELLGFDQIQVCF